ncbi:type II CAAX endopeptidase family protein [Clostridium sp. E02]|uniref:CPBP family intramembrane glutamic endopeptidase n=1 Tax=Clostridium sp. E02 TaxID=2487134 RepID=UPI000F52A2BB|nr:type II CAAX endopeptidase family protein [Clostridium sp. E02]
MEDKKRAAQIFRRIGFGYSAFLGGSIVVQILFRLIMFLLTKAGIAITDMNGYMFLSSLANYLIGGSVVYLIIRNLPTSGKPVEQRAGKELLIHSFFICVSGLFLGNIMGQALMKLVSALTGEPMINPIDQVVRQLDPVTILIVMVIMAPICEEFLFRKLLIDRVRIYGDRAAILISAIIFGLSHGNFYQFFYAFGIGLVLAYVYIRTGRLRYTILFHMIINFMGSIIALQVQKSIPLAYLYSLFLLGSVVIGIVLFFTSQKKWVLEQGEYDVWNRGRRNIIFRNAGMILFFLISAFIFVITELF